jgi:glucan 1,3-beta-glucosidase
VGTAVEHHVLYQYQFSGTKDIFAGFMQTETPYYQPTPAAPTPFTVDTTYNDPDFATSCTSFSGNCASAWGLRVVDSSAVLVYGAGFYSFFSDYSTTCSDSGGPENCQTNIVSIEGTYDAVNIYNLNTVGTTNMLLLNGDVVAVYSANINVFPDTVALFQSGSGS